jgi:demethylmenaquinone methyltransferase / 2-methoxy-6-polyprenyl-1,4-benzoquinol methylase
MENKIEVKPYSADGSKKEQIAEMFNNVAHRYDFLNRALSLGIDVWWRKKALLSMKDLKPKNVLDVATGTADVAIMCNKLLSPDKIVGVDISAGMLEQGDIKIANLGLQNKITLQLSDGELLPFPDNSFDAVTIAYGIRNFENVEKGLAEMHRVLKPNGEIMVLEFSKPTIFPFKQLFNFYFKNILPIVGRLTSKDPKAYTYLFESVQTFPDGQNFVNLLVKSGFKNSKCIPLTLGISSIYKGAK